MIKLALGVSSLFLAGLLLVFLTCSSMANPLCGELRGGWFGPYDYTDAEDRKNLAVVENHHFTPKVENLVSGSTGEIWGDLAYTLRAFPNHHRALYAFAKYEIRERQKASLQKKNYIPPTDSAGGEYPATAECYFDRAIRWRPNDANVYLIYGIYLHWNGMLDKALTQYKISERLQPKSADLQYNFGLLYFEKKQYPLAKQYAKKAYQLGYPLPGLRKKLASVGQWP